jgi:hypothetical protein
MRRLFCTIQSIRGAQYQEPTPRAVGLGLLGMAALLAGLAIMALLMAPTKARADENPLTIAKCLQVYAALSSLDGYQKVVADKPVTVPYRFGGPVRFSIAQAITALRPFQESTEKARLALLQEIGKGKPIEPGSPELAQLNTEYTKVIESPCGASVPKIKLSELKLGDDDGQNPIPPGTLSLLMPVIDADK